MKKILIFALMVLVGISLISLGFAEEARTITHKTKVCIVNTLVAAHGVTVYSVNGYAGGGNNAVYALVNQATLTATPASSAYKVEGGEATQYDSIPTVDFGDDGIRFDTGLAVFTSNAYLVIEYD